MPCAVVPWKQAAPAWLHAAWGAHGQWACGCGAACPAGDAAFVLDNAAVQHADGAVPALQSVDLHIQKAERVALVGASGAGKSTVMAVLAGEQPLSHGRVQAVPSVWLTQRVALFQDSVRDNLRLAAPHADDRALSAALEDAGLAADVRAMPQGLDSGLGEGGLGLSGGQARRLGLARLLLAQQPAWLLDSADRRVGCRHGTRCIAATAGSGRAAHGGAVYPPAARGGAGRPFDLARWRCRASRRTPWRTCFCSADCALATGLMLSGSVFLIDGQPWKLPAHSPRGPLKEYHHGPRHRRLIAAAVRDNGALPLLCLCRSPLVWR